MSISIKITSSSEAEELSQIQNAGYCDTGERIIMEGTPALAMFKKAVSEAFDPAGVSIPMIYEVEKKELSECQDVIHQSFYTVAE